MPRCPDAGNGGPSPPFSRKIWARQVPCSLLQGAIPRCGCSSATPARLAWRFELPNEGISPCGSEIFAEPASESPWQQEFCWRRRGLRPPGKRGEHFRPALRWRNGYVPASLGQEPVHEHGVAHGPAQLRDVLQAGGVVFVLAEAAGDGRRPDSAGSGYLRCGHPAQLLGMAQGLDGRHVPVVLHGVPSVSPRGRFRQEAGRRTYAAAAPGASPAGMRFGPA